jgi:16S rRNA (guanine527-N7)-methyltransferase
MSTQAGIKKIYDFGSGPGFPGAVFALLYPQVEVVLVEGDVKKAEFLTHLSATLKLKNVTVIGKGIETLPEGSVQHAMARGFANISRTIMAARKSMVKGGSFYHLKGEEWGIEVGEIPTQLCSMWSPSLIGEYKLPVGAIKFAVVKTEKIA